MHFWMEVAMRDLALQAAGVLAIVVAIVHGAIAELQVFPKAQIEPRWARRLLRMVFQASTVDWIAIGVLLIATPTPAFGVEARRWIVAVAVIAYGYGAVGNAVVTRGRHFGWWLMGGVVLLALLGL
jgi:hypothetical protein